MSIFSGTQYIDYKNLSEFLDVLEPPLQIPRPNKFKIIHMDIPIVRQAAMLHFPPFIKTNIVFIRSLLFSFPPFFKTTKYRLHSVFSFPQFSSTPIKMAGSMQQFLYCHRWTSPESGETKEDMVFCTGELSSFILIESNYFCTRRVVIPTPKLFLVFRHPGRADPGLLCPEREPHRGAGPRGGGQGI